MFRAQAELSWQGQNQVIQGWTGSTGKVSGIWITVKHYFFRDCLATEQPDSLEPAANGLGFG
ncbi:MAG: hypothetical protein OXE78_00670 [Gammaproteobacteria bacterium]|nr:hypothetical protein [Gammaproteobacteria bacterium]MCY4358915.1 hypothetical protein [Gammaproteobacteria bacterium]